MERSYLSIPKLQRLHRWSLGMDESFHFTLHWACNYLAMLGLKFNHVSKMGHRNVNRQSAGRFSAISSDSWENIVLPMDIYKKSIIAKETVKTNLAQLYVHWSHIVSAVDRTSACTEIAREGSCVSTGQVLGGLFTSGPFGLLHSSAGWWFCRGYNPWLTCRLLQESFI